MSKIFISYRRDDSAGYAGRLYDRLDKYFGDDHLFMDIDQIEPGEDFVEVLQKKTTSRTRCVGTDWQILARQQR